LERAQRGAALDLLLEFLAEYASLETTEALQLADLEEFFIDGYVGRSDPEAAAAELVLDTVGDWLEWSHARSPWALHAQFQPLQARLSEDLPRVLEAWQILADAVTRARLDDAAEASLTDQASNLEERLLSAGLDRILHVQEIDYGAAREDHFRVERLEAAALVLRSPSGAALGEEPIGPVRVPERVAELLRPGDILHLEVAPRATGWEILEITQVLPHGYGR
jgi:hypothetical protein